MVTLEPPQTVQFKVTEAGAIRIGESRVSLDSVEHQFSQGATPEQVVDRFPSLTLAEVYGVFSYILANREEIDLYLKEGQRDAARLAAEIEVRFPDSSDLSSTLRSRWEQRQNVSGGDA